MAYSNVTPPTLPEYDSETYGFYVLVFNYELGAEDWYMCHLIYGAWRFQYEEGVGVTNTGTTFTRTYSEGSWSEETQNTETLALNPGASGVVYQRIYTNANIFNGDEIWLAENSVTPVEGQKFPIKDFINGMIMTLCGRAVQWPKREPVELFLYGTPSESGNIGLRVDGSVTLYDGAVMPPIPDAVKAYRYQNFSIFGNTGYKNLHGFNVAPETREISSGGLFPSTDVRNGQFQEAPYYRQTASITQTEWHIDAGYAGTGTTDVALEDIKWANYDVLNLDGSVYLAASEPIPVGEIVDYINEIPIYEVI